MRAVEVETPKVATIAANLVALILLQLDDDLHFVDNAAAADLAHAEHAHPRIVAHFHQLVMVLLLLKE